MKNDMPSLKQTSDAVAFVDRLWNILFKRLDKATNFDLDELLKKIEAADRKVGHAFWLDTADRNAQDTCENHIRSDSVRDWVNKWRSTQKLEPLLPTHLTL